MTGGDVSSGDDAGSGGAGGGGSGALYVPAYPQEDGSLICTAPVNSVAGEVEVDVTLNGMQYATTGNTLRFTYLTSGMVFVSHVLPPLGPVAGGTNVSVYGTNFVPREIAEGLACSFDGLVVNATFLSTSHLLCDSPPARMSNPGVVTVEMSLNRQEFYSGSTFAYAAEGQVGRSRHAG